MQCGRDVSLSHLLPVRQVFLIGNPLRQIMRRSMYALHGPRAIVAASVMAWPFWLLRLGGGDQRGCRGKLVEHAFPA